MPFSLPNHYDYAFLSQHVYQGNAIQVDEVVENGYTTWEVRAIEIEGDYLGVLYKNASTKQLVLAHRGTDNIKTLLTDDIAEIYFSKPSTQHTAAFRLVEKAVALAKKQKLSLSFTGHSLGAFLAELSVLYCHRSFEFPEVSAVTFESPGSRTSLEKLNATHGDGQAVLEQLDIISYLSYPNIVNTAHPHVGTLYSVHPDMGQPGWVFDVSWYTKRAHSIDGIVDLFQKQPQGLRAAVILDWPTGNQRFVYDKHVQLTQGQYEFTKLAEVSDENARQFALDYQAHFKVSANLTNENSLALRHFPLSLQVFLPNFYSLLADIQKIEGRSEQLCAQWKEKNIPAEVVVCLLSGYVVVDSPVNHVRQVRLAGDLAFNIQQFTQIVRGWLATKPQSIVELLQIGGEPDNRIKVVAQLVAEGAEVYGTLRDNKVTAATLKLPSDADEQLIAKAKEMQLHLKKVFKEINVYLIAPGAKVHKDATIEGNSVSAGDIEFTSTSKGQAPNPGSLHQATTLGKNPGVK